MSAGQLHLFLGPMFSGKSLKLVTEAYTRQNAGQKTILVKHAADIRYTDDAKITTHDKIQSFGALRTNLLFEVKSKALAFDVIGIDEAQFFEDLVPFCQEMLAAKKTILVASLDSTFEMKPFGNAHKLIHIADTFTKLNGICRGCGQLAPFSKRLVGETEVQLIGGDELYAAVCRECYELPLAEFLKLNNNTLTRRKVAQSLLNSSLE